MQYLECDASFKVCRRAMSPKSVCSWEPHNTLTEPFPRARLHLGFCCPLAASRLCASTASLAPNEFEIQWSMGSSGTALSSQQPAASSQHDGPIRPPRRVPIATLPPKILLSRPPCFRAVEDEDHALEHRPNPGMPRLSSAAHIAESSVRTVSCGAREACHLHKAGFG